MSPPESAAANGAQLVCSASDAPHLFSHHANRAETQPARKGLRSRSQGPQFPSLRMNFAKDLDLPLVCASVAAALSFFIARKFRARKASVKRDGKAGVWAGGCSGCGCGNALPRPHPPQEKSSPTTTPQSAQRLTPRP
ncbi:MAG: hypothetical protein EBS01_04205 [Verrucomicrobia bacterium]|nr:hypothetical protein [Verrucomicrobiota bacterium]